MGLKFQSQIITNQWTDKTPLGPPIVNHSSRGDWQNRGVELYREVFGDQDYQKYSQVDLPVPMPKSSGGLTAHLYFRLLKARTMFGFKALATGRRATHMSGVGGRGNVKIVDSPTFPEHEFFQAGQKFPCRIRHANASFYDDASIQVRGFSIKFADSPFRSPLDIIMNSGATAAFWSFGSFMAFVEGRMDCTEHKWDGQKVFMHKLPLAYVGTIESVRVSPTSWDDVTYYSKIAFPFHAKDGKVRYCKYRAIKKDLKSESGLVPDDIQRQPWVQCRPEGNDRPRSYLADEYRQRLANQPIEYDLQIQIREWHSDNTAEFFNPSRYWDESQYPWQDLATVSVESALNDSETASMGMWLGHQPASLGLTNADSFADYRSLAWARAKIYPTSRRFRSVLRTLNCQRKLPADF